MAGRKYKPALYELVDKGPVKPDKRGSLVTPKWFFRGREKAEAVKPKFVSAAATRTVEAAKAKPVTVKDRAPANRWGFLRQWTGKIDWQKFNIKSSHKVAGLIGIGAILLICILGNIIYKGIANNQPTETSKPQSQSLASARTAPITGGILPQQANSQVPTINRVDPGSPTRSQPEAVPLAVTTQVRTGSAPAVSPAVAPAIETPAPAVPAVPLTGQTLVICSNESQQALADVQEYFTQKGIKTGLGRFNDRFVLFTTQTFSSISETGAQGMKAKIAQLGAGYNKEKPKGAVSYTASTFESAYWVKIEKIEK